MEMTYENDNRGSTYLERYARMELLSREKSQLKIVRALWQSTSDLARESFVREKLVGESEKFMNGQREAVVAALNRYLPAMAPNELEARKRGFVNAIRLHTAATFLLGCLALVSLAVLAIGAYRRTPRGAAEQAAIHEARAKVAKIKAKEVEKKAAADSNEPTMHMDLQGLITRWSPAAEEMYGYSESDIHGQSISKLFESESEISRLYNDLLESPQTIFQTTHRTKSNDIIRVRIEFRPVADSSGHPVAIGLICSRK